MNTIINVSNVADYSGEAPVVTYSNPVTTVIRQNQPVPVITRYAHEIPCCCSCNSCCNCCNN